MPEHQPSPSKAELRRSLLQQRNNLTPLQQQQAALAVCGIITTQAWFQAAKHIAFYFPIAMELDPLPIMRTALAQQKKCYLPVITTLGDHNQQNQNHLLFVPCNTDTQLVANKFNILEPAPMEHKLALPLAELDIIFLPLVGFDQHGNRLGMGAGYYDATLTSLRSGVTHAPQLIGLAYTFQAVARIPCDPWDITIDGVVTETGFTCLSAAV